MTFNKIYEIIENNMENPDEVKKLIEGFEGNALGGYIARETIEMISDQHYRAYCISNENMLALAYMLKKYFDTCWKKVDSVKELEKYWKASRVMMYKVEVDGEIRYATQGEIKQGIENLIGEYNYPIGIEKFIYLCVMMWMFTGECKYLTVAGVKLNYSEEEKRYVNTLLEKIFAVASAMNKLFEWVGSDEFDDDIQVLKDKARLKFKYATYASNEIVENIDIKQIAFDFVNKSSRNISKEVSRAYILCNKYIKNNMELEPLEKSFIRKQYRVLISSKNDSLVSKEQEENENTIKEMCNDLLNGRACGRIPANEFAFKIIQTISSTGYNKVSPKQCSVIMKAHDKYIGKCKDNSNNDSSASNEIAVTTEEDTMLIDMSDMLGSGDLD